MNYLKTKIYKTHGEKYTLTKLIINITLIINNTIQY